MEEREREEARRVETPQSHTVKGVGKKRLKLTETVTWTQRVEERRAHLYRNPDAKKDI